MEEVKLNKKTARHIEVEDTKIESVLNNNAALNKQLYCYYNLHLTMAFS